MIHGIRHATAAGLFLALPAAADLLHVAPGGDYAWSGRVERPASGRAAELDIEPKGIFIGLGYRWEAKP